MGKDRQRKIVKTQRQNAVALNNATFFQYYHRLCELAISSFEWLNVPDTIDTRYLELLLLTQGHVVFFKDEVMGYLALQGTLAGPMNVYNIPQTRQAIAPNGYSAGLTGEDSVIIYNNLFHTNSKLDIEMFAHRLYDIDRTIDINARAQKTPVLLQCEDSQRLTMENLYNNYNGNMPVIMATSGLQANPLNVLKTDCPFVGKELYELKTRYWNEALTMLGIVNVAEQKRERMVSDEVNRSMGGVLACRYARLEARQRACREINRMFDLNIDCQWREGLDDINVKGPEVTEEVVTDE